MKHVENWKSAKKNLGGFWPKYSSGLRKFSAPVTCDCVVLAISGATNAVDNIYSDEFF